jgi:hypothetical protein
MGRRVFRAGQGMDADDFAHRPWMACGQNPPQAGADFGAAFLAYFLSL